MKRNPLCTDFVIDSLVPTATTVTTRESIAGTVRMFRAAVAYLLPVTSRSGVGYLVGVGLGTLLDLISDFGLFFFAGVGVGVIVGRARSRLSSACRSWVRLVPADVVGVLEAGTGAG